MFGRVLPQFGHKLAIAGAGRDVRRDALANPHMLRGRLRAVDQLAVVHRAVIDVRQVHELHRRALEVGHGQVNGAAALSGIQLDQRVRDIVRAERDGVAIRAAQPDVRPARVLADDHPRLLIGRVGQFAVQRMRVTGGGDAHRGRAAVDQKAAVRLQIVAGGVWPVEHGPHGEVAPAKGRGPNLLPLEGQHDQFARAVR